MEQAPEVTGLPALVHPLLPRHGSAWASLGIPASTTGTYPSADTATSLMPDTKPRAGIERTFAFGIARRARSSPHAGA
jgi:hypothetical protein